MFKVLRNGLLRYILYTCPNLWCNSCSKCYGMDCSGTYFTHVQTCDVTRVQSATEWTLGYILHTCPNLWCNSCSKCYGMDCSGTYFTHVQTCDVTRVQSATEWAPHCCDHEVLSSMAMEVWKCLVPWLVQDHNKNVPKLDLTKSATKMQPIPQRNEKRLKKRTPFSGPKKYGHVTIPCK